MYQIIFFLLLFITINAQPIFAKTKPALIKTNLTFFSEKYLGVKNNFRYTNRINTKIDLKFDLKNLQSQLSLNYNGDEKYNFDGSYLQHSKGIITFGIGSVERHWSFSKNTSLILSKNARPIKSIYLKLENKFKYNWLPSKANWSLEVFNGFNESAIANSKSMLLGARAILSPYEWLDFELIQTSQWGGKGYNNGISALGDALFFDTNIGPSSNINKMAGFGISYLIPNNTIPLRIYAQAIGEDEAGNLPSCYAYLAGFEWSNSKIKFPTIIGIETIDTRINKTKNRNCGPNTMYNNGTYDYTNYGKTMGTAIDTEGTSLNLNVRSQISQTIDVEFSTKSIVINDNNWSEHRLSSKRQPGLINSFNISWKKNNIELNTNFYTQDFNLDKVNIKDNHGIGFSLSVIH
jgi:hypothetical protein